MFVYLIRGGPKVAWRGLGWPNDWVPTQVQQDKKENKKKKQNWRHLSLVNREYIFAHLERNLRGHYSYAELANLLTDWRTDGMRCDQAWNHWLIPPKRNLIYASSSSFFQPISRVIITSQFFQPTNFLRFSANCRVEERREERRRGRTEQEERELNGMNKQKPHHLGLGILAISCRTLSHCKMQNDFILSLI